ncbi:hypothetical protein Tco_0691086 [Tanacetum coccineum]
MGLCTWAFHGLSLASLLRFQILPNELSNDINGSDRYFRIPNVDAYDSDCDDVSTTQAVLMANLSNYGSDVILEVPHSKTYYHDMDNQSVHAMQNFKQIPVVDFIDNEITSDSNIIS